MPILCQFENCRVRASFGLFYGKPLCCKEHKTDDMKSQYNVCPCGKGKARYNYYDLKKKFCSECKQDGMIDISDKSRICIVCKKKCASFNYANETKLLPESRTITERIKQFKKKHGINTSFKYFRIQYYEARNRINKKNDYPIKKLESILPFLKKEYIPTVIKVENDIIFLERENADN